MNINVSLLDHFLEKKGGAGVNPTRNYDVNVFKQVLLLLFCWCRCMYLKDICYMYDVSDSSLPRSTVALYPVVSSL